MKAIRVLKQSTGPDALSLEVADVPKPQIREDQCLVEIRGSGLNPSDAKGLLGVMPDLVWPRTPGRDYAGIVVEGSQHWLGKEVWGGGSGILGMGQDGAHAEFMAIDTASLREKPKNLSLLEASGIGVTFTCAYMGLIEGAMVKEGETVVVLGANGKVGQAVIQLATMMGARVIGVERKGKEYRGHATSPVDIIDGSQQEIRQGILDRTDGQGADIIYNTVGSPYFEQANQSLAQKGRQIIIATFEKEMTINLLHLYRGNHRLIGVSNMALNTMETAQIYDKFKPGFESGALQPYPVKKEMVFSLERAREAYEQVLSSSAKDRIYINPQA